MIPWAKEATCRFRSSPCGRHAYGPHPRQANRCRGSQSPAVVPAALGRPTATPRRPEHPDELPPPHAITSDRSGPRPILFQYLCTLKRTVPTSIGRSGRVSGTMKVLTMRSALQAGAQGSQSPTPVEHKSAIAHIEPNARLSLWLFRAIPVSCMKALTRNATLWRRWPTPIHQKTRGHAGP